MEVASGRLGVVILMPFLSGGNLGNKDLGRGYRPRIASGRFLRDGMQPSRRPVGTHWRKGGELNGIAAEAPQKANLLLITGTFGQHLQTETVTEVYEGLGQLFAATWSRQSLAKTWRELQAVKDIMTEVLECNLALAKAVESEAYAC